MKAQTTAPKGPGLILLVRHLLRRFQAGSHRKESHSQGRRSKPKPNAAQPKAHPAATAAHRGAPRFKTKACRGADVVFRASSERRSHVQAPQTRSDGAAPMAPNGSPGAAQGRKQLGGWRIGVQTWSVPVTPNCNKGSGPGDTARPTHVATQYVDTYVVYTFVGCWKKKPPHLAHFLEITGNPYGRIFESTAGAAWGQSLNQKPGGSALNNCISHCFEPDVRKEADGFDSRDTSPEVVFNLKSGCGSELMTQISQEIAMIPPCNLAHGLPGRSGSQVPPPSHPHSSSC